MTTQKRRAPSVTVEFHRSSAYFGGALQRDLVPAAQAAGSPHQWHRGRRALGVPAQFAAEVEARLVAAGFTVHEALREAS